ncbi:Unspecific peroxygenase [Ascochyta rabiei]|uniref:Unspecific peroxygenase n=1 Tax=Didymella rabiei TaxID=5454 RepID=UPI0021FA08BD|nr:Unspecific peroxygenase [Ascochyta rabiei]UPX15275.1 Unspecific peroxygenase [Ascochyta rabiei]
MRGISCIKTRPFTHLTVSIQHLFNTFISQSSILPHRHAFLHNQRFVHNPALCSGMAQRYGDEQTDAETRGATTTRPCLQVRTTNTGLPALGLDAQEQLVSVGAGSRHEFQSPGGGDIHGQCPGLNAAANHNFIPRNGLLTTAQTVQGLGDAYNMSPGLALFLAVMLTALARDPVSNRWSIGGKFTPTVPFMFQDKWRISPGHPPKSQWQFPQQHHENRLITAQLHSIFG